MATSILVTVVRKEAVKDSKNLRSNLAQILCIRYLINFRKKSVLVLFDSSSEVNAIYPNFAKKLSLPIRPMDVRAQKIDGNMLDTFRMVVAAFSLTDKANQVKFFKETFLVASVGLEVVFGMLFLILSSSNVDFLGRKL